jgi:hypothetical protein
MTAVVALSIFSLAAVQPAFAQDDRGFKRLGAILVGFEEIPSISTGASGQFERRAFLGQRTVPLTAQARATTWIEPSGRKGSLERMRSRSAARRPSSSDMQ